ncbi:hypothetical protein PsYK624_080100 [Phanerochaete sordida]|uniref:G domain-containing protein n=1 Tax=Phanerochaete sordida TaxID=48140 RepID=A0A9P3GCI7_9APHY|nr:hypothetical protein PsYK624_080100 [Phanerochaete sordida]
MVLPSLRSLRLHESKGLQNGSSQALEAVKDFVESRKSGPAAGRLHAIWYCVEAPAAGGRAFEAGDITLLESLKKSGNKVPVIIVFTKFDRVEFREQRRLQNEYIESGMDERQAVIKAKTDSHSAALKTYHKTCVASLKSNLPSDAWTAHCAISSKHKESILSLVGLTTSTLAS